MEETEYKFGEPVFLRHQELMGLLANALASADICKTVVCVQGVYRMGTKLYGIVYYDKLIDITSKDELTLVMPPLTRAGLYNDDVIQVRGTLQPKARAGEVSLYLHVSQAEKVSDEASQQYEKRRSEILRIKEGNGSKDVKELLLGIFRSGKKPRIALVSLCMHYLLIVNTLWL